MRSWALGMLGLTLLSLGSVGCDQGSATALEGEPEPVVGAAGGGTGGNPSGGGAGAGAPSEITLGGAKMTGTCQDPQPWCLASCGGDEGEVAACVGGKWHCPDGRIDRDTCPADSCALHAVHCCAPNGEGEWPPCGTDGLFGECPAGLERSTSACVPAGLGISSCRELENGMACDSEDLVCNIGGCSGGKCSCQADESGKLSWSCAWNAC